MHRKHANCPLSHSAGSCLSAGRGAGGGRAAIRFCVVAGRRGMCIVVMCCHGCDGSGRRVSRHTPTSSGNYTGAWAVSEPHLSMTFLSKANALPSRQRPIAARTCRRADHDDAAHQGTHDRLSALHDRRRKVRVPTHHHMPLTLKPATLPRTPSRRTTCCGS